MLESKLAEYENFIKSEKQKRDHNLQQLPICSTISKIFPKDFLRVDFLALRK